MPQVWLMINQMLDDAGLPSKLTSIAGLPEFLYEAHNPQLNLRKIEPPNLQHGSEDLFRSAERPPVGWMQRHSAAACSVRHFRRLRSGTSTSAPFSAKVQLPVDG